MSTLKFNFHDLSTKTSWILKRTEATEKRIKLTQSNSLWYWRWRRWKRSI